MGNLTTDQDARDRLNVSDTLYRYCSTIDQKDYSGLRAVFTEDARMRFSANGVWNDWIEGADAIVAWVDKTTVGQAMQHHLLSVYHVDVEGDQASILAYLTSHQSTADNPNQVLQMSSRYRDRLRRAGDGWLIAQKELEICWAEVRTFDQQAVFG